MRSDTPITIGMFVLYQQKIVMPSPRRPLQQVHEPRRFSVAFIPDTGSSSNSIEGVRRKREPANAEQSLIAISQRSRQLARSGARFPPVPEISPAPRLQLGFGLAALRAAAPAAYAITAKRPRRCRPIITFSNTLTLWNTLGAL